MSLRTAWTFLSRGRLRLLFDVHRLFFPFYKLSFLSAAVTSGLLRLLAHGPRSLPSLCSEMGLNDTQQDGLRAWLGLGVRLGVLREAHGLYRIEGLVARKLADPAFDDVAALVEEIGSLHHRLILETPKRLRSKEPWQLADFDAALIARSSRIMEPFVAHVIDWALPTKGPLRLLEIGCGAGVHMRYAAERNPQLHGVGIELDEGVARSTQQAIAAWGLQHRLHVEAGDVRDRPSDPTFDVVTLYNVLYYFPVDERIALLTKLAAFLRPGGRLVLSTSCQGGSAGMQVLDILTSNTAGLGRLPTPIEVTEQLLAAGFAKVTSRRAIPGESYHAFCAEKAAP